MKNPQFLLLILPLILIAAVSCSPSTDATVLFRDDFESNLEDGWRWGNEDSDRWRITEDGWLSITADNPTLKVKSEIIGQVNVLLRDAPPGSISLTARLLADPQEDFQQAAIYLIADGDNYVAINTQFCERYCFPQVVVRPVAA